MFCEKCGAKNPDGATFCSTCGAAVRSAEINSYNYKAPIKQSGSSGWLIALGAAIVGIVGYLFLPWITVSGYGESSSLAFFDLFDDMGSDGDWFYIFFAVSAIFFIFSIITLISILKKKSTGALSNITGTLGLISFFCMMFEVNSDEYAGLSSWGIDVSIGFGVWLMFIASIALILVRFMAKKN